MRSACALIVHACLQCRRLAALLIHSKIVDVFDAFNDVLLVPLLCCPYLLWMLVTLFNALVSFLRVERFQRLSVMYVLKALDAVCAVFQSVDDCFV